MHRRNDRKKSKTDVLNEDTYMIFRGMSSWMDLIADLVTIVVLLGFVSQHLQQHCFHEDRL